MLWVSLTNTWVRYQGRVVLLGAILVEDSLDTMARIGCVVTCLPAGDGTVLASLRERRAVFIFAI